MLIVTMCDGNFFVVNKSLGGAVRMLRLVAQGLEEKKDLHLADLHEAVLDNPNVLEDCFATADGALACVAAFKRMETPSFKLTGCNHQSC